MGTRLELGGGWARTDADDIELEAALEELALDLGGDAVETNVAVGHDAVLHGRHIEGMPGVMCRERGEGGTRIGEGPDCRRAEAIEITLIEAD